VIHAGVEDKLNTI